MPSLWESDPQRYDPCLNCGGSGWETCMNCQGRGGREVEGWTYSTSYSGSPRARWQDCFICYGKGEKTCTGCNGTGRLRKRRFEADAPAEPALIREVDSPVPGNESLYDELKDQFYAARKEALDSLDGQALSAYSRELVRERLRQVEFSIRAATDLGPVVTSIPPTPYEHEKLKELGVEHHEVDSSNYPDHESQYRRQFAAERVMLRIFYFAAARGLL
jgi:hypothetical protein